MPRSREMQDPEGRTRPKMEEGHGKTNSGRKRKEEKKKEKKSKQGDATPDGKNPAAMATTKRSSANQMQACEGERLREREQ
ncbi:hypothetical protein VTH06DRAFT_2462 [Thermothelomyces fergusii]